MSILLSRESSPRVVRRRQIFYPKYNQYYYSPKLSNGDKVYLRVNPQNKDVAYCYGERDDFICTASAKPVVAALAETPEELSALKEALATQRREDRTQLRAPLSEIKSISQKFLAASNLPLSFRDNPVRDNTALSRPVSNLSLPVANPLGSNEASRPRLTSAENRMLNGEALYKFNTVSSGSVKSETVPTRDNLGRDSNAYDLESAPVSIDGLDFKSVGSSSTGGEDVSTVGAKAHRGVLFTTPESLLEGGGVMPPARSVITPDAPVLDEPIARRLGSSGVSQGNPSRDNPSIYRPVYTITPKDEDYLTALKQETEGVLSTSLLSDEELSPASSKDYTLLAADMSKVRTKKKKYSQLVADMSVTEMVG